MALVSYYMCTHLILLAQQLAFDLQQLKLRRKLTADQEQVKQQHQQPAAHLTYPQMPTHPPQVLTL